MDAGQLVALVLVILIPVVGFFAAAVGALYHATVKGPSTVVDSSP